jgi:hypothetical protein
MGTLNHGSTPPPAGPYRRITLYFLLGLGVFTLSGAISAPGWGQQGMACGPRAEIVEHLAGKYREQPVARGLADNGALVEVLATEGGDSFTLMFSFPNGQSCLVATGSRWEFVFSLPKGRGA